MTNRLWQILHRYMSPGRDFDARPGYLHLRSQLTSEQLMQSEMVLTLVRLRLVSRSVVFSEALVCSSESWRVLTSVVGRISLRDVRALSLSGSSGQFSVPAGCSLGYSTVFNIHD